MFKKTTLNDVWRQIPNRYVPETECIYDKEYYHHVHNTTIWMENNKQNGITLWSSYHIEDNFVRVKDKTDSSVYLTPIFNSNIYQNKIIRCKLIACAMVVGFSSKAKLPCSELQFDKNNKNCIYYCVDGADGEIRSHLMKYWKPWNKNARYNTDDTIILELNFITKEIILYKNDKFVGIMFDKIDTNNVDYQLTVHGNKCDTFEIFYCSVFEQKFGIYL